MIRERQIRRIYEGRLAEAGDQRAGAQAFLRDWREMLGLNPDPAGAQDTYIFEEHRPVFGEGRAKPDEVSLRGLADAIMGYDFVNEYYHPSGGFDFGNARLMEAAIDPSAFINVNLFNLATSGLIFAQILERFNQPGFIGYDLVNVVPTKKNSDKLIGVANLPAVSSTAKGRQPGEEHASVQFGEAYQTTPATVEQALKCEVTREAVFFDLTGDVMTNAGTVGDELRYGQEKDIVDLVEGTTNNHNRNGTSYNTYQTASPWINDQSNPFADWNDVDDARQLFVGMTDPETGKEIRMNGMQILGMPGKAALMRQQIFGGSMQIGTQLSGNFPTTWTLGGNPLNPYGAYQFTELTPIWYNRAMAADGLGLSAANAKLYWWIGDFKQAFEWRENWPLTPWQAMATELIMKDRGLIAVYGANYRGVGYVRRPQAVIRNKN